jgi:hypothetical protein
VRLFNERSFPCVSNPAKAATRPVGSLNKKTLAVQALLDERAEEIVTNLMDRSKNGEPAAMRLVSDRLLPTGRNRLVAIELPLVKTSEDAELALSVVLDELAAGKLTLAELSALITAIDRMLRLADRIAKMQQAEAARAEPEAPVADAPAPQATEKPAAPLYSPVNLQAQRPGADPRDQADGPADATSQKDLPLARAA